MVYLSEKNDGSAFTQDDEQLLTHFAGVFALMLAYHRSQAERERAAEVLREISQTLGAITGEAFFQQLVSNLTKALGMNYAFVGEVTDASCSAIRTVALSAGGRIADNFVYELPGTPCENVVGKELCFHVRDVQQLFPDDHLLVEMGIESYIGSPLFDSQGKPSGILVLLDDKPLADPEHARAILKICAGRAGAELERRRQEQALRLSEEHYHLLAQLAPVGIFRTDAEGHCTYVNNRWCDIAGIDPEQAHGEGWVRAIHPDDRKHIFERWYAAAKNDQPFMEECRMQRPDGVTTWVLAQASAERGIDGRLTGYVGSITDITDRKQAEKILRENNEILGRIFDSTHFCVAYLDRDFNFIRVNRAYAKACGNPPEHFPGKNHFHLYPNEENEAIFRRVVQTGEPFTVLAKLFEFPDHPEWGVTYWDWTLHPLKNPNGNVEALLFVLLDVTERKTAEDMLARLGRILDASSNEIYVIDAQTLYFIQVNQGAQRNLGYTIEELKTLTPLDLKPEFTRESFEALLTPLRRGEQDLVAFVTTHRRKDGSKYPVEVHLHLSQSEHPPVFVSVIQDITERKSTEERLSYLAYYDSLTGLPNRQQVNDSLYRAMLEAESRERLVAVMFLDLDRFKNINDTLGHDVGDALLKEVAVRLKASLRPGDSISRLGGDEFILILGNIAHINDVTRVAQKILDQFIPPFRIAGRDLFISPSVGITLYPFDDDNPENLLRNADIAMYRAKELGRNNFQFYTPELNARAARRLELETGLRRALENEEFILHYQPLVNMQTGKITGMEALLRWQHPEFGLIPPMDFIPLAEETGLIVPIGEWVLRTACAQIKTWHATGFPAMHVAVNLSSVQLQQKNFADTVKKALRETGLEPQYLDLELTESLLMHDMEAVEKILKELKALGVLFSLDDFGTGYSSLSYLKRFPIDFLKIDRSFVNDINQDRYGAGIVRAIIVMAHTLGIKVIAEGVESAEQLEFLRKQGCDITQGYFCSEPLATETFTDLLKDWQDIRMGKCSVQKTTRKTCNKPARNPKRPSTKRSRH
jgi:diguanylate cyclase (GGDEF)-like protein/PAS domain S-box-containing protein